MFDAFSNVALSGFKQDVRGNKSIRDVRESMEIALSFISPFNHSELIGFMKLYPKYFNTLIVRKRRSDDVSVLDRYPPILLHERRAYNWFSAVVSFYESDLIAFLSEYATIKSLILNEVYDEASDKIRQLEIKFGGSLALTFDSIYIDRLRLDEDAFLEKIDGLVEEYGNTLASYFVREWAKIFSSNFSERDFRARSKSRAETLIKEDFLTYFVKFWSYNEEPGEQLVNVLSSSSRSSIIDLFLCLSRFWPRIRPQVGDQEVVRIVDALVKRLAETQLNAIRNTHKLSNGEMYACLNEIMFYGIDSKNLIVKIDGSAWDNVTAIRNSLFKQALIYRFSPIESVMEYAYLRISNREFEISVQHADLLNRIEDDFASGNTNSDKFVYLDSLKDRYYDNSFESSYARCLSLTRKNEFVEAYDIIDTLPENPDTIFLKAYLLGKMERVAEFISLAAEFIVKDKDYSSILPLSEFLKVKYNKLSHVSDKLDLSIALHGLHDVNPSRQNLRNLRYAWQDFMRSRGVKYPSDLFAGTSLDDDSKLVYFGKNICIESVMVFDKAFSRQRDVENERVKIYANLMKSSPEDENFYRQEILKLTTKHKIEDELKRIDRSRIFVDVGMLFSWARSNIGESFDRIKHVFSREMASTIKSINDAARKKVDDNADELVVVYVNSRESEGLLNDMINGLLDNYLNNKQYGLDAYMSMRIRHGSFSGNLRSPLQSAQLIAYLDEFEEYHYSSSWISQGLDPAIASRLEAIFVEFSKCFDKILEKFTGDLLRVRSDEKPEGLFYVDLTGDEKAKLKEVALDTASLDTFVMQACEIFKKNLNQRLVDAKSYILDSLKPEIEALYSQLRVDVIKLLRPEQSSDFLNNYDIAKVEMSSAINRVAEWFSFNSEFEKNSELTTDDYIDLFIESAKLAHIDFDPQIDKNISLNGEYSEIIIYRINDIIFTLLDNVYRHSGYRNPHVDFRMDDSGEYIDIQFSSPTASDAAQIRTKVSVILKSISEGRSIGDLSKEGNTGLKKIDSVAKLSGGMLKNVEVNDSGSFQVQVLLGKK